ncbi:precorrin-2 C(20)-methyltransferase [Planktothrix sp. FACHB-1355]|uniref:Precorrin-2 C(20)-methyltransferase n=1 Tax=Aerosakkonema funiforme FACHB-1375 TaxID=2949571 RepID=A0A926ZGW5_9CYAN|nr:precorrin-2 C(20)-methyltransferase [Aerosakkonema funiforme]MBD2181552.1 precorrin-2 C(20)-methyltransferase [Aerosakkonema funiforme FACHB-1375]MBD3561448.1 precorrin-2 C(20)-methyltransferase [Planktothrix sp. FACHB-1355]
MQLGTLYGISVGTGDPELITLKALRLLKQLPVVAFPLGVGGKPGMAEQIVAQWLTSDRVQLALTFPYVQDEAVLTSAWQLAAEQVWQYLEKGMDVAFACEGDVSFYSTFTYLAQTLQQLHPEATVETVPGVCSPMAAAAMLGLPLTVRDQRLVVLPALYRVEELEAVLDGADVVVLLKVSSVYEQVWQVLQRRQLLSSSYVVERATLPDMKIYRDLRDRPDLKLPYFSLLIVQVTRSD